MRLPGLTGMVVAAERVIDFGRSKDPEVRIATPIGWKIPGGFPRRRRSGTTRTGASVYYVKARAFLKWAKEQEA